AVVRPHRAEVMFGEPHALKALLLGIGDLVEGFINALRFTAGSPGFGYLNLVEQANSHGTVSYRKRLLLWPAFGDDVPVPRAGLALQLLFERKQLKAGEKRNESGRIAIEMRMPAFRPVDDKGAGGDGAAFAVIAVADRQHRALI